MGMEEAGSKGALSLSQVALNTSNLSGSLRLYCELFGFRNAGGNAGWGQVLAMQDVGPDAHCIVWWLVGAQPFFQLEFFSHGNPVQRPQPADWRPCDLGWVRIGIHVADFERVLRGLEMLDVAIIGESGAAPHRKLAFRDPYVGDIVEVIEHRDCQSPALAYATSSVADLDAARAFYRDVLGAPILPLEGLHTARDEALWGLADARREGFLVDLPNGLLEILQYQQPLGKPRPADHRTSDQGLMNMAIGSRDPQAIRDLIARVHASGHETTVIVDTGEVCATYIVEPGYELELMALGEDLDAAFGFIPASPFITGFGE